MLSFDREGKVFTTGTMKHGERFEGRFGNRGYMPFSSHIDVYEDFKKIAKIRIYKSGAIASETINLRKYNKYGDLIKKCKAETTYYDPKGNVIGMKHDSRSCYIWKGDYFDFYMEDRYVAGISASRIYRKGEPTGKEISYYPNGEVRCTGEYKDGKAFSGIFFWSNTERSFENGTQVGEQITYDQADKIIASASIKDGEV